VSLVARQFRLLCLGIMSQSFATLEVNGRPFIIRNTFIESVDDYLVDDAVSRPRPRARSGPSPRTVENFLRELPEFALNDEPLGDVRHRLFSPCLTQGEAPLDVDTEEAAIIACGKATCDGSDALSNAPTDTPSAGGVSTASCMSFESATQAPQISYSSPVKPAPAPPPHEEAGDKTTLMFRNLPEGFNRSRLEALLDAEGFAPRYDFLYLPANLGSGACFGYALINMVAPSDARAFIEHFQGFDRWPVTSDKRALVHMSEELQGLNEMIERYRNSPLMHESIADELRPAVYRSGTRAEFPGPTAPLKAPRVRKPNRKENGA